MQPCNFNKKLIWWLVASGGLPLLISPHLFHREHHQQTCTFVSLREGIPPTFLWQNTLCWEVFESASENPNETNLFLPRKKMISTIKNLYKPVTSNRFNRMWTLHESKSRWWRCYVLASSLLVCVVSQNVGEKNPSEPRWNLDCFKLRRGSFSQNRCVSRKYLH